MEPREGPWWDQTSTVSNKISVLLWQLAVDKVWHFQINFYWLLSPYKKKKKTQVWWIKPKLLCAGEPRGKVGHKLALQRTARKSAPVVAAAAGKRGVAEASFQVSAQCQENNTSCVLALQELSPGRSRNRGGPLGIARKSWIFMWSTHKASL